MLPLVDCPKNCRNTNQNMNQQLTKTKKQNRNMALYKQTKLQKNNYPIFSIFNETSTPKYKQSDPIIQYHQLQPSSK